MTPTIQEILHELDASLAAVRNAQRETAVAAARAIDAHVQMLALLGQGPTGRRFAVLYDQIQELAVQLAASADRLETAISWARAAAGETGSSTASPAPIVTRRGTAPAWVTAAGKALPERLDNQGPTLGVAFDAHGRPLSAAPWSSGRNVASTADLRPLPRLKGFPWTLTDHVEARVAQEMRRPGAPSEVTLVLNNPPCVDDPYGCDRVLRHILPSGSRLTVYLRDKTSLDEVRLIKVYEGTGKGIRP